MPDLKQDGEDEFSAADMLIRQTVPEVAARTGQRTPAARVSERKVLHQPAFVLHSWPYKETSLIVDVLTRDHGRVSLVAKGAKRPHSQLRSILQTFQPLQISWSGKSEMRTLTSADWVGGMLPLERSALLCGFYLNELLVKFLLRDEAQPRLFQQYVQTLTELAHDEPAVVVLRAFEFVLLREAGLLSDLQQCSQTRQVLNAEQLYMIDPEAGVLSNWDEQQRHPVVHGKTLQDMAAGNYADLRTQAQSRLLMRHLLNHHLHGAALNTRQILIDLQKL